MVKVIEWKMTHLNAKSTILIKFVELWKYFIKFPCVSIRSARQTLCRFLYIVKCDEKEVLCTTLPLRLITSA